MTALTFPRRARGCPTAAERERYEQQVREFCSALIEMRAKLDFEVSSRGWCYILEEHGITKGDFRTVQEWINNWRKDGHLPIDICVEDESRVATLSEDVDDATPDEFADSWIKACFTRIYLLRADLVLGLPGLLHRDGCRENRSEGAVPASLQGVFRAADERSRLGGYQ